MDGLDNDALESEFLLRFLNLPVPPPPPRTSSPPLELIRQAPCSPSSFCVVEGLTTLCGCASDLGYAINEQYVEISKVTFPFTYFECTLTFSSPTSTRETPLQATGTGGTKKDAKTDASERLLVKIEEVYYVRHVVPFGWREAMKSFGENSDAHADMVRKLFEGKTQHEVKEANERIASDSYQRQQATAPLKTGQECVAIIASKNQLANNKIHSTKIMTEATGKDEEVSGYKCRGMDVDSTVKINNPQMSNRSYLSSNSGKAYSTSAGKISIPAPIDNSLQAPSFNAIGSLHSLCQRQSSEGLKILDAYTDVADPFNANRKVFTCTMTLTGKNGSNIRSSGSGNSKKTSKRDAAESLLEEIEKIHDISAVVPPDWKVRRLNPGIVINKNINGAGCSTNINGELGNQEARREKEKVKSLSSSNMVAMRPIVHSNRYSDGDSAVSNYKSGKIDKQIPREQLQLSSIQGVQGTKLTDSRSTSSFNAVGALHVICQKGIKQGFKLSNKFSGGDDPCNGQERIFMCRMLFTGNNDLVFEATGKSSTKKDAKRQAAEQILFKIDRVFDLGTVVPLGWKREQIDQESADIIGYTVDRQPTKHEAQHSGGKRKRPGIFQFPLKSVSKTVRPSFVGLNTNMEEKTDEPKGKSLHTAHASQKCFKPLPHSKELTNNLISLSSQSAMSTTSILSFNPTEALNSLCQRNSKQDFKIVENTLEGVCKRGNSKMFECTLTFSEKYGETLKTAGSGSSKKIAKRNATELLLRKMDKMYDISAVVPIEWKKSSNICSKVIHTQIKDSDFLEQKTDISINNDNNCASFSSHHNLELPLIAFAETQNSTKSSPSQAQNISELEQQLIDLRTQMKCVPMQNNRSCNEMQQLILAHQRDMKSLTATVEELATATQSTLVRVATVEKYCKTLSESMENIVTRISQNKMTNYSFK